MHPRPTLTHAAWTGVAQVNGDNQTMLVASENAYVGDVELDLAAGHIYYVEKNNDRLQRANLDGTGVITILDVVYPEGLALYLCLN